MWPSGRLWTSHMISVWEMGVVVVVVVVMVVVVVLMSLAQWWVWIDVD